MIKKKLSLSLTSTSLLIFLFFSSCSSLEQKKKIVVPTIKDPISLEKDETVIQTYFKEIMAKDEISRIDLLAKKGKEPFYFGFTLLVDGVRYKMDDQMKGYKPNLLVTEINNDNLSDLMVTVKSGNTDNSVLCGLYTFKNRVLISLITTEQQNGIVPLQLKWLPSNKIQIQSQTYKINTKKDLPLLDISLQNSMIGISGYVNLEVFDYNKDFQNELIGQQYIWIKYPHQVIYNFKTVFKLLEGTWKLIEYSFLPLRQ